MSTPKRLLYVVSDENYFYSHRLSLAKEAVARGYQVAVLMACPTKSQALLAQGIQVFPAFYFHRSSLKLGTIYQALQEIKRTIKIFGPHLVHNIGLRLTLLGGVGCLLTRVPAVCNTLGGVGYSFTPSHTLKERAFKLLLRGVIKVSLKLLALRPKFFLIVQNKDDQNLMEKVSSQVVLIPGSGVSLKAYPPAPLPPYPPFSIVCLTRLLKDKGVREFVEAARILRARAASLKFILYGAVDPANPSTLGEEEIQQWHKEGVIEWKGFCRQVAEAYQQAHIVVLPSYREGLPKSLLEAASCARAIVTTDVPGCRDVVVHGLNGFIVPPRDSFALAQALLSLSSDIELCEKMGRAGRSLVESCFSESFVHEKTFSLYQKIMPQ